MLENAASELQDNCMYVRRLVRVVARAIWFCWMRVGVTVLVLPVVELFTYSKTSDCRFMSVSNPSPEFLVSTTTQSRFKNHFRLWRCARNLRG